MASERRVGGRYLLARQVGSGGMGTVWQARDEMLRRDVAVKMLRLQPGVSDEERQQAVERAMREARIAARLHHPNAVQVYDVVDDADGPCLILQYVPSRSLGAVVGEDGPLAPHDAARVGTQLAAALAAAHRVGIVHRDIKPGNVLMADDGTVKITDFGVSHAFDDVTVTSTGLVTGTPAYLAPEVARGEQATAASDVYSLGSTLYFAVEGRSPYGDDGNQMAVLHRVASGQADPPRHAGALTDLLTSMLAADPAQRPSMVTIATRLPDLHPLTTDGAPPESAQTQVIRAIARDERPQPVAAVLAAPPAAPRRPSPAPPTRRRRPLLLPLGAAVLAVILAAVIVVVALRSSTDTENTAASGPASTSVGAPSTAPSTESSPAAPPPEPAGEPEPPAQPTTPTVAPTTPTTAPTTAPTTPPTSTTPTAQPSADELTAAVVDYYRLIPGDLDAGWQHLTPQFQQNRAGGRATYDDFWGGVQRVDVRNTEADAPRTVRASLVYRYKNGDVVQQRTTFKLKREDGILKIDKQG